MIYKNIHLNIDGFSAASKQFNYIPDFEKYLYTFKWNPLFSLTLQSIHKTFDKTVIVQVFLAQLISGFSCLSIFLSTKKLFNIPKLALLMMAIHPMLVLYGSKFCTENFCLVAISIYLATRLEIRNSINLTRLKLLRIQIKSVLMQLLCTLFRAQNIIFFIYEIACLLKDFSQNIINKFFENKKNILLTFLVLGTLSSIFYLMYGSFTTYISVMSSYFWDNPFLLSAKKVFVMLFPNTNNLSNIELFFCYVVSYILYLFFALILLTGARERLINEPWAISIGNFNFNYSMGDSLNGSSIMDLYDSAFLVDFALKILLPLILFSSFHIIGLIQWYKNTKRFGPPISVYILSIGILPLILHPMMRYYIPLIPISCIGCSILFKKFYLRN